MNANAVMLMWGLKIKMAYSKKKKKKQKKKIGKKGCEITPSLL